MSPVGAHFNTQRSVSEEEHIQQNKRLEAIPESCGFAICSVAADDNCCFGAVAYSLIDQMNSIEGVSLFRFKRYISAL